MGDVKTVEGRAALLAVCEAATPGPWRFDDVDGIDQLTDAGQGFPLDYYPDSKSIVLGYQHHPADDRGVVRGEDGTFIALARTALPEAIEYIERLEGQVSRRGEPVPVVLACPTCGEPHVDEGEWETRPHRTHLCLQCKAEFRPANIYTVGVAHLPENQYSAPRRQDPRDARIERLEQALREAHPYLTGASTRDLCARVEAVLGKDGDQ